MRVVIFCHSLESCWNHGNAHFLRGIAVELQARGHRVEVLEPADSWSRAQLVREHGPHVLNGFRRAYPTLVSRRYRLATLDLDAVLDEADLVLVHEWNAPELVARIGRHREAYPRYRLFFHDTHHRMVSAPHEMARYELRGYDGVLAFGSLIRELYVARGWAARAWTWHEASDVRVFQPRPTRPRRGELVWIGNWGDEERADELREFVFRPVAALGLTATAHGVRYPARALAELRRHGIRYRGWLANHEVPATYAGYTCTVHVPRRFYATHLPGIPTIRPFEALACGIPLVSSPWEDTDKLFKAGEDYLLAHSPREMTELLRLLAADRETARTLAESGRRRVLTRHTCAHRADELLRIAQQLAAVSAKPRRPTAPRAPFERHLDTAR